MTKNKGVTAAELMARLQSDPEWVAARAKEEKELRRKEKALQKAERPLLKALAKAGFKVSAVEGLASLGRPYTAALPILLEHLQREYPDTIREFIARMLAVREADFARPTLIRLFRTEPNSGVKEGLAVAIAEARNPELLDEIVDLIQDPRTGTVRLLLLRAVERLAGERLESLLEELAQQYPDLQLEIQEIRKRTRRSRRPRQ